MTLAALTPTDDLLEAYVTHCALMAPSPGQLRGYVRAAETFQIDHPDLAEWMTRPVDARLVELSRRTNSWPFVFFALLGGWCRGDLDFLVAKKFGHTGGRTVGALHPSDVARLRDAARRIGHSDASFNNLLGGVIPLAIAHFGVPPSALRVEDLEALVAFIESSPRACRLPHCEPPMTRRSARSHRAFRWHRPVNQLFPTASRGFQRRCSRPASRTGSAHASWPLKHAPMPTCARPAPTSSPPPSSSRLSRRNCATSVYSVTTLNNAAGCRRSNGTSASSQAWSDTSEDMSAKILVNDTVDPTTRAG